MQISAVGITRIKNREGLRLTAYRDSGGVLTIGYGSTRGVREGQTITLSQAEELLTRDIVAAENLIYSYVTVELNQNQFDAICDAAFNLGSQLFRNTDGSKTHFLGYVNSEQFHLAAEALLSFDHVDGKVISGLLSRRTDEEHLFETPCDDRSFSGKTVDVSKSPNGSDVENTASASSTVESAEQLISDSRTLLSEGAD